jgi:hypothetical protein
MAEVEKKHALTMSWSGAEVAPLRLCAVSGGVECSGACEAASGASKAVFSFASGGVRCVRGFV